MFVFIAGAMITGLLNAHTVVVKRLSHIPLAILDIVLAVAGAITIISASSQSEICSGLYSFISKLSTKTSF